MIFGKILGGVTGGLVKPLVDGATDIVDSKERTNRLAIVARIYAQLAASTWRPELARAAGACLVVYVLFAVVLASTHLVGIVFGFGYVKDLYGLWSYWGELGVKLFAFCGLFLTSYGVVRSVYDKQGKESFSDTVKGMFQKPPPVITQRAVDQTSEKYKPIPGVRARNVKRAELYPPVKNWKYSERSLRRLRRADSELEELFHWLLPRSPYDIAIGETTRSVEKQKQHVQEGTSKTMESRHLETPAMAVDFFVINPKTGKVELNDIDLYREVLQVLMHGSEVLNIPITSGGIHWGWDFFHVEKSRDVYPYNGPVVDVAL